MCQNPIQTRHHHMTIALGRNTGKRRQVISMLKASAGVRRSVQRVRTLDGVNLKDIGNTEGNPMEDSPKAVVGK